MSTFPLAPIKALALSLISTLFISGCGGGILETGPNWVSSSSVAVQSSLAASSTLSSSMVPASGSSLKSSAHSTALSSSLSSSARPSSARSSSIASSSAGLPLPKAVTQKVVRVIYFVESDQIYSLAKHQALKQQALALQKYWKQQFGGSFYLYSNVVDVIQGDHPAQWYLDTPDSIHVDARWFRVGNMKTEVYSKLGLNSANTQVRIINYPSARYDGSVSANFGGAWMDGDDITCLLGDNNGATIPYSAHSPAHCLAVVAHELGHVFGLSHTGFSSDCMQYGVYNTQTMCEFGAENRQTVINSADNIGWLNAQPGELITPQGEIVNYR